MKSTIKTVSFTIEELRNMLAITLESGNTQAADEVISKKISEKADRLARQREKRRLRSEQKKSENSENSEKSEHSEKSKHSESSSLTLTLDREIAGSIVWIYNRSFSMKTNIGCFLKELMRSNDPIIKSIESAIDTIIRLTKQAVIPAQKYLNRPACSRPKTATISL
ncbi:MAG: hypothetical protein K2G08_04200 [Paramuribaculum sp.]|nr:hypothetical protein [Paramuribaculum sp.]